MKAAPISSAPAAEGDVAELAAFAERAFRDTYARFNTVENMQRYVAAHFSPARLAADIADPDVDTLLLRGPKLLAYAQLISGDAPSCVEAAAAIELRRFYLDRSAHGSGLARELLRMACDGARRRQATHLWLGVWERNERARAFYRKVGFKDVGTIEFVLGEDRQNDRVLVLELPG